MLQQLSERIRSLDQMIVEKDEYVALVKAFLQQQKESEGNQPSLQETAVHKQHGDPLDAAFEAQMVQKAPDPLDEAFEASESDRKNAPKRFRSPRSKEVLFRKGICKVMKHQWF